MLRFPASRVERMAGGSKTIDELRLKCPGLLKKARAVEIETYKIKGYMRLVPFKTLLAGTYKSLHVIPDLVGLHFKKRYPSHYVITWNEARRDGCISVPAGPVPNPWLVRLVESSPVDGGLAGDVLIRGGLYLFQMPPETSFAGEFLPSVIEVLFPGDEAAAAHVHDKREFEAQWAAFYDTQVIDSRVNYERATALMGKRQLVDQVGASSIEAQRVLKKVPKGLK
ncbi:MAG: DUF4130 domain-containing protein, partial [Candidatus Lokiarchaeota archaeon]|nr:DUF4130 domain-containing protein [Candidatus Lokiarchaeota archaeon]